jgi:prepilin-type N-terminal cleavage/methylation domain-containing protein
MIRRRISAFTLVEILTVVVIIGILTSVLYTTLFSGWSATEEYATRARLWQDMNRIIDQVTVEVREATRITVGANGTLVNFFDSSDPAAVAFASCQFTAAGVFSITRMIQGAPVIVDLTDRVDPAQSLFSRAGETLVLQMVLADNVFSRRVQIETSTEILPRNQ